MDHSQPQQSTVVAFFPTQGSCILHSWSVYDLKFSLGDDLNKAKAISHYLPTSLSKCIPNGMDNDNLQHFDNHTNFEGLLCNNDCTPEYTDALSILVPKIILKASVNTCLLLTVKTLSVSMKKPTKCYNQWVLTVYFKKYIFR